jgi:myo-inositol 2-dehydrogenase/D-chiro-inositol 1-dehydrogenase
MPNRPRNGLRLGLAGCGRIGRLHAEVLHQLPDVDELVVADLDAGRAEAVAARLDVKAVGSLAELLASVVDAVVVATATDTHPALVQQSVTAGLPTFCEKPLAPDVPATLDVIAAIEGSGVTVQMGFQRRFDPGYRAARRMLAEGRLGWLHGIRSVTSDAAPPPEEFIAGSGGLFRDCLVHDFDSIRWLTGREIVSVFAQGSNAGAAYFSEHGDVDTAAALLTLDDGTLATVTSTRYNGAGHDVRLELLGERDSVAVGLDGHTPLTSLENGVTFPEGEPHPSFAERFAAAYRAEMEAFVTLARDGGPSPCTPHDALEAFYVAEAAELSRARNRPVDVSEVRR